MMTYIPLAMATDGGGIQAWGIMANNYLRDTPDETVLCFSSLAMKGRTLIDGVLGALLTRIVTHFQMVLSALWKLCMDTYIPKW